MAPVRVIEDSDGEGDDALSASQSPEKEKEQMLTATLATPAQASVQKSTSSTTRTDPILFQSVYNDALGSTLPSSNKHPRSSQGDFPTVEELISNQTMSSSPAITTKLKRSKTIAFSSLDNDSGASAKQAKRSKSMRETSDQVRLTPPRRESEIAENEQIREDPWEFPSSGPSQEKVMKVRSRNAEQVGKKTPGKLSRRSNSTVSPGAYEDDVPRISRHSVTPGSKLKRSSTSREDAEPPELPVQKRRRRSLSNTATLQKNKNLEVVDLASTDIEPADTQVPSAKESSSNTQNTSINGVAPTTIEPGSVQVPRSTTEKHSSTSHVSSTGSVVLSSVPISSHLQVHGRNMPAVHSLGSATETASESSSMLIQIPQILTSSQRQEYHDVDATSTDERLPSPLPPILNLAVSTAAYPSTDSTYPNTITPSEAAHAWSYPAAQTMERQQVIAPIDSPSPLISSRRKSRVRTTVSSQSPSQGSADELSLDPTLSAKPTKAHTKGKRRRSTAVDAERVDVDQFFGSDEVELPKEMYQPRPSSRRSKSMGTQESDLVALDYEKPHKKKAKFMKAVSEDGPSLTHVESPSVSTPNKETDLDEVLLIPTPEMDNSAEVEMHDPLQGLPVVYQSHMTQPVIAKSTGVEKKKPGRKKPALRLANEKASMDAIERDARQETAKTSTQITPMTDPWERTEHAADRERVSKSLQSPQVQSQKTPVDLPKSAPASKAKTPKKRGRRAKTMPAISSERINLDSEDDHDADDAELSNQTQESVKVLSLLPTSMLSASSPALKETTPDVVHKISGSTNENTPLRTADVLTSNALATLAGGVLAIEKESLVAASSRTSKTVSEVKGTRDAKDKEHSPLQAGRVKYRVGLSKSTRIAPLLKIIRK